MDRTSINLCSPQTARCPCSTPTPRRVKSATPIDQHGSSGATQQAHWKISKTPGQVSDQEIDLLRFQVEEISTAALDREEITDLEQRYRQSLHSSRLVENANQGVDLISAAVANLTNAKRCILELEKFDPSVIETSLRIRIGPSRNRRTGKCASRLP